MELVLLAMAAGGLFGLVWLWKRRVIQRTFRALGKTLLTLALLCLGIYVLAALLGQADSLERSIDHNAPVYFWLLTGGFLFGMYRNYERPRTRPEPARGGRTPSRTPSTDSSVDAIAASIRSHLSTCPTCRGSGTAEQDCTSCNGMGESQCDNVHVTENIWGYETSKGVCEGGRVKSRSWGSYGDDLGVCPRCNGRGFVRCYACRSRGRANGTCGTCGGKGSV